jgi:hypothetical protein
MRAPGQQRQQAGFAHAVGPDQADHAPAGMSSVDAIQGATAP